MGVASGSIETPINDQTMLIGCAQTIRTMGTAASGCKDNVISDESVKTFGRPLVRILPLYLLAADSRFRLYCTDSWLSLELLFGFGSSWY